MESITSRVLRLNQAAVVAVVALVVIVAVLGVIGILLVEGFLVFGSGLDAIGITSPTVTAAGFAGLVIGSLILGCYVLYQRYINL